MNVSLIGSSRLRVCWRHFFCSFLRFFGTFCNRHVSIIHVLPFRNCCLRLLIDGEFLINGNLGLTLQAIEMTFTPISILTFQLPGILNMFESHILCD